MSDAAWSFVLLGLRVAVCVALYLFLLAAFRALRAELRGPALANEAAVTPTPPRRGTAAVLTSSASALAMTTSQPPAAAAVLQPAAQPAAAAAPIAEPVRATAAPRRAARPRGPVAATPLRNALIVMIPLLMLGGTVVLAARDRAVETELPPATQAEGTPTPPAHVPGRVTVGLTAQEDSGLRVTVDNVVQFSGVLRAGQQQRWEGAKRIQVWTDRGRTLVLSVNGNDLGPYSPAMGHPEWNRIDFAFQPSWRPSQRADDDD